MQTSGTTDQSTRFPVVSGATGFVASLFPLMVAWIEDLFRLMEKDEDNGEP